jgi:hypothetical protein
MLAQKLHQVLGDVARANGQVQKVSRGCKS